MKLKIQTPALDTLNSLVLVISQLSKETSTPWVDQAFIRNLVRAETRLREARNNLNTVKDALQNLAEVRLLKGGAMIRTVRDFYQVLSRAALRDEANAHWLSVFSGKAEMPIYSSLNHPWFEVAQSIVDTNLRVKAALQENAQAFEAPLPSNPSPEDVAARLEAALEADQAWRNATLAAKERAEELRAARDHVLKLLTSLRFAMRSKMVGWSHQQRRKVLRVFGFNFDTEASAEPATPTPDEDDPLQSANPPTVNPKRATA